MSLNYLDAAIKLEDENKLPGIMMKEYGVDYFFNGALQWDLRLGIHAAKVAPEFCVTKTLALKQITLPLNS